MTTKILYGGETIEVPAAANVAVSHHTKTWEEFAEQAAVIRGLPDSFAPVEVRNAGETVWATRVSDNFPNGDVEYTAFAPTDDGSVRSRLARARKAMRS